MAVLMSPIGIKSPQINMNSQLEYFYLKVNWIQTSTNSATNYFGAHIILRYLSD